MDEAAGRIAPGGLRLMVRHRQEKENRALAEMQAAFGHLAQTERDLAQAADHRGQCEENRTLGEREIYDRLSLADTSLTPAQLSEHLTALSRLTEVVEAAERRLGAAQSAVDEAKIRLEDLRANFARCARDAAKWVHIEDSAIEARRREGEFREELEIEDEVSLRHGRRDPGAGS